MTAGERLRAVVDAACPRLLALTLTETGLRPAPGRWSAREIVGHLIDSATNNHRRFVLAMQQDDFVFPGYAQDAWVALQHYQEAPWTELVTLWRELNRHLARIMDAAGEEQRTRKRHRHNLHQLAFNAIPETEPATLEFFMQDYIDHIEHHLRHLLPA
jgi:hypothetical protein